MEKTISYDRENDILVAHKGFEEGEKFKGNVEVGDLVLDISTRSRVRGIEIMNASSYLMEFIKPASSHSVLENIKDVRFSTSIRGSGITLAITIIAIAGKKELEIPAKIAIPMEVPVVC
jgi:uncharacterized protein YuzE